MTKSFMYLGKNNNLQMKHAGKMNDEELINTEHFSHNAKNDCRT